MRKFLIISLSEDVDLTFLNNIGSTELNLITKEYE